MTGLCFWWVFRGSGEEEREVIKVKVGGEGGGGEERQKPLVQRRRVAVLKVFDYGNVFYSFWFWGRKERCESNSKRQCANFELLASGFLLFYVFLNAKVCISMRNFLGLLVFNYLKGEVGALWDMLFCFIYFSKRHLMMNSNLMLSCCHATCNLDFSLNSPKIQIVSFSYRTNFTLS